MDVDQLCAYLRQVRLNKGLSQKQVAQDMGFHSSNLSQLELGKIKYPMDRTLQKWAQALGFKGIAYKVEE